MKIVHTDLLTSPPASETEKLWIYNGLDCCVTQEVFEKIEPELGNVCRPIYEFEKSLQGPVLDMKLRGVRVDLARRDQVVRDLTTEISRIETNFHRILREGLDHPPINWASPAQVKDLFYERLRLPPTIRMGKVTVDRKALERLQSYFIAQPLVSHILTLRDLSKEVGVLRSEIDPDGRFRTSYNIAGTDTGRFSSNISDFGTGNNSQNIDPRIRPIFIADEGMKFAYVDLEQAESRLVGAIEWNLFEDPTYLDACEGGDLHTAVSKMVWPKLAWTGDPKRDKVVANQLFYRHYSYRDGSKKLGHASNYKGTPPTVAERTGIELRLVKEFQPRYFAAFPAHRRWHDHVAATLAEDGCLISLMGRRRHFFGRLNDPETIRAAVAYDPQGSVGDILNRGMLQVWRAGLCQLLFQIHDAILIQYPEAEEDVILPQVLKAILVPVSLRGGRTLVIPSEAKVGWNWGEWSETNPAGLKKYEGNDARRRPETPGLLDRQFR